MYSCLGTSDASWTLAIAFVNPVVSVRQLIEGLQKYVNSEDLTVAIYLNSPGPKQVALSAHFSGVSIQDDRS